MKLQDYDNQTFTDEQERAINTLNDAIVEHFEVMGVDPEYTDNVWEKIDEIIRQELQVQ